MRTTTRRTACQSTKSEHRITESSSTARDMLATLGAFAIAPLWSLQRQGIRLTPEEEMAHVAVWRHIGYAIRRGSS